MSVPLTPASETLQEPPWRGALQLEFERLSLAEPDEILAIMAAPAPCDGCPYKRRCGAQLLACEAFAAYVEGATDGGNAPRAPSRAQWSAVFLEAP